MASPNDAPALDGAQLAAWAEELGAMATLGLLYGRDPYDLDRYRRIQNIAAAMLGVATAQPASVVRERLAADIGYVTVKVGVAAAVFDHEGRQLLVQRQDNGLWAQPGGWADVGESPANMTVREVQEETGLTVRVERLVGLYDSRRRQFRHPHHIYHVVFLCSLIAGTPAVTHEIRALEWFAPAAPLPPLSPGHQPAIADAFGAWADPGCPVVFD
ncbi:MAG TPA: NUDIX hydrolase N-terminal domain-containing protein [Chloroflexota bacterium]|nr:NUDIX hydrolase N-terminal domain-containing protein [Chloroflexota bacterium]